LRCGRREAEAACDSAVFDLGKGCHSTAGAWDWPTRRLDKAITKRCKAAGHHRSRGCERQLRRGRGRGFSSARALCSAHLVQRRELPRQLGQPASYLASMNVYGILAWICASPRAGRGRRRLRRRVRGAGRGDSSATSSPAALCASASPRADAGRGEMAAARPATGTGSGVK